MKKLLPEVCTIQYGFPFDSAKFSDSNGTPLIRIRDVVRGYSETYTTEEYKSEYIVHENDLLIGMDGEFNIAKWGKTPALLNQRVCRLAPKDSIDKDYLFYFMPIALKRIEEKTPFVTVKHLSAKELNKIEIPVLSLEEQRKIAETLSKVDELIAFREQQLAKLDELVKARFVEMFGTYPKNENGFPVAVISDVANVSVGVVIKPAQYYVTEECGIKAFRSLNIGEMYIKDSDWVYFSTEGNESNKKSQLHENDLLIVRSGAPGTSCVVTKEFEGCNAVDVIIAHPNLSKVNPWYLCAYINYPHGKKQIEEGTGGAAQQHFNVGKCNNLKVLLPPLEPQNQFAAFVERVNQQKQTVQQSLEKLELMKKALMQEYFG